MHSSKIEVKVDGRASVADATESRNASGGSRWAGLDLGGEGKGAGSWSHGAA